MQVAQEQVVPGGPVSPTDVDAALSVIVEDLMGIAVGTARYDEVIATLTEHIDQVPAGTDTTEAIRSAFTLGCASSDLQAVGL